MATNVLVSRRSIQLLRILTALILLAVLIPITLTVQIGQITTLGPLFKNIAILGGLLFFVLNDTGNLIKT